MKHREKGNWPYRLVEPPGLEGNCHNITHLPCLPPILLHLPPLFMLSRSASVNTSCRPCPVFAEHSAYLAPISLATAAPCSGLTGFNPCALSIRRVCSSPRKSVLVPTNINGVPSQKWATSGNHYESVSEMRPEHTPCKHTLSVTFSRLVG